MLLKPKAAPKPKAASHVGLGACRSSRVSLRLLRELDVVLKFSQPISIAIKDIVRWTEVLEVIFKNRWIVGPILPITVWFATC